jgi:L-rhamnose mutarotase
MRYTLALDLVDDVQRIADYEKAHEKIWPEVREHLVNQGVIDMEIYRLGTRLFMIMEVDETVFDFVAMTHAAQTNPIIVRWESLMWTYQLPTPWTPSGEKWMRMTRIFSLAAQ